MIIRGKATKEELKSLLEKVDIKTLSRFIPFYPLCLPDEHLEEWCDLRYNASPDKKCMHSLVNSVSFNHKRLKWFLNKYKKELTGDDNIFDYLYTIMYGVTYEDQYDYYNDEDFVELTEEDLKKCAYEEIKHIIDSCSKLQPCSILFIFGYSELKIPYRADCNYGKKVEEILENMSVCDTSLNNNRQKYYCHHFDKTDERYKELTRYASNSFFIEMVFVIKDENLELAKKLIREYLKQTIETEKAILKGFLNNNCIVANSRSATYFKYIEHEFIDDGFLGKHRLSFVDNPTKTSRFSFEAPAGIYFTDTTKDYLKLFSRFFQIII